MNYKEQYVEAYRKYIRRDGAASLLNWLMTTDFLRHQPVPSTTAISPVDWRSIL